MGEVGGGINPAHICGLVVGEGCFGRKRLAFEIFKPLVAVLYERRHLTAEGLVEAQDLADQLARHNQRGSAPYSRRGGRSGAA